MKVATFMALSGYLHGVTDHVDFVIHNRETDNFITIEKCSLDQYMDVADRDILEWFLEDGKLELYVSSKPNDAYTYRKDMIQ